MVQTSDGEPQASKEEGESQAKEIVIKYLSEVGENREKERDREKDFKGKNAKRNNRVFKLYETSFKFNLVSPIIEWFFTRNRKASLFLLLPNIGTGNQTDSNGNLKLDKFSGWSSSIPK